VLVQEADDPFLRGTVLGVVAAEFGELVGDDGLATGFRNEPLRAEPAQGLVCLADLVPEPLDAQRSGDGLAGRKLAQHADFERVETLQIDIGAHSNPFSRRRTTAIGTASGKENGACRRRIQ
jgi:hypothetical protein